MKLNHFHINNEDCLHKPQREHAIALHKLYVSDELHVPSVKEILIHRISLTKYFNDFMKDLDEYEINEDEMIEDMAMCDFLDIDYDGIIPYDPHKQNNFQS